MMLFAIVRQFCCLVRRAITCAWISKEILGLVEGENWIKNLCECKTKNLTSESLHTIMWIALVIQQIWSVPKTMQRPKFTCLPFIDGISPWALMWGYLCTLFRFCWPHWDKVFPISEKMSIVYVCKGIAILLEVIVYVHWRLDHIGLCGLVLPSV